MTYLAQLLGTTLMGVVSLHSPAQLGRMDQAVRKQQSAKGQK